MIEQGADPAPEGGGADQSTVLALLVAVLLVVVAALAGFVAANVARPEPTATPGPLATPRRTAGLGDDDLFLQPLSAGCATSEAVWVVSEGGGIGRFDGERWSLVDRTLRSLSAAVCVRDVMLAVGGAGRVVTANDTSRTVRVDTTQLEDLNAVSPLPDGALAAGGRGTVMRQVSAGWGPYAEGLTEDLYGIAAFSSASAWVVGAGGATYRLEDRGWLPVASGVTHTLRSVAGASAGDVVAVGDGGTILRFDGSWRKVDTGFSGSFRAVARAAGRTWVAGDAGAVYVVTATGAERRQLGTTCTLRGIFARGDEVWFVGSDGPFAAVWRLVGERVDRWGLC